MNHIRVPVAESSQPSEARRTIHGLARTIGMSDEDGHRAGIIATELATNLVKHTIGGGEMLMAGHAERGELEILALDRGPGIVNVGRAMTDGYSTTGSPGTGLGAVRRLADDFDIYSTRERGTGVLARVRRGRRHSTPGPLVASGIAVAEVVREV